MAFPDTFSITALVVFIIIVVVIIGLTVLAIYLIRKGQQKGRDLMVQVETNPQTAAGLVGLVSKFI